MFVSQPSYEFAVPRSLSTPGARYWRAVELSMRSPWFIATFELRDGDIAYEHSMCVFWDTDLVHVIESSSSGALLSLQCVSPPVAGHVDWGVRRIEHVWRARMLSDPDIEVLLFRDGDGTEFRVPLGEQVSDVILDRKLVASVAPHRSSRSSTCIS